MACRGVFSPFGPLLNPLFTGSGRDGVSATRGAEMTIEMREDNRLHMASTTAQGFRDRG